MLVLCLLSLIATGSPLAHASQDGMEVKTLSSQASSREQYDRDVDRAAVSAQDSAVAKLHSLLRKYAGTHQEPILLSKLAELQQQKAGMLFRIAHGAASRKTKSGAPAHALDLGPYHKTLDASVTTLNILIAKYPSFEEIAHAYFTRGKAYEEMEKKTLAANDYDLLISRFPQAEETSPAYMALADFAIEANNHPKAIAYLKELEKRPEDPHYPFALYKLAWSYYNLKNVPAALGYAEKQIAWYNEHASATPAIESDNVLGANSDNALRENTLLDVPVFYFDAVEAKDDRYPTAKALAYFRSLSEGSDKNKKNNYDAGPIFGKMALRFAKLLRTRDMEPELIAWKDQFLKEEPNRPEGLDIVIITYEFLQNRREYAQVENTALDIVQLKKNSLKNGMKLENLGKAQKMILDTAESLQALIVKNKQTEEAHPLSLTLSRIYDAFTQVVDTQDPRVPQVHYNLAETLFVIQDYDGATLHYRWVVDHLQTKNKEVLGSVADAGVKAIAAHYEVLQQKHLIAQELKAQPLPSVKTHKPDHSQLNPLVASWVDWIDAEADKRSDKNFDNFLFEANRSLYAQGNIEEAFERLEKFARQHPESAYAIPSASLVIDTALASKDWDRTIELSKAFQKIQAWKATAFSTRLTAVTADCTYKKIEEAYAHATPAQYGAILSDVDSLLSSKEYAKSDRIPDALSLAGAVAVAASDHERAMGYFSRLIQMAQNDSKNTGILSRLNDAIYARAALEEEEFIFVAAANDYRTILDSDVKSGKKLEADKAHAMRRKILALAYLSGDVSLQKSALSSKTVCTEAMTGECDKYRALAALQSAQLGTSLLGLDETNQIFDRFRKMPPSEARTLWAIYTLEGAKHLGFRDRNLTLRTIGAGYKDLDAMSKFVVMPLLASDVQKTFELNRIAMKDVAPLRADERYITHRVDMIREMENAATEAMQLPWARIRAGVLNETAYLYLDLAHGLAALPAPKNMNDREVQAYNDTIRKLTVPFEEKGQDIRTKAFAIASGSAIEDSALQSIAEPFFSENPSQAKKLKADAIAARPSVLSASHLAFVPLGLGYAQYLNLKMTTSAKNLYANWMRAVQGEKWSQVSFFLQQAREKKLFSDAELSVLKGISLTQAGARGEGLAELDDARKNLPQELKTLATLTLARQFEEAFSASRSKPFYSELTPASPPTHIKSL
jgi:TolA-binding protein